MLGEPPTQVIAIDEPYLSSGIEFAAIVQVAGWWLVVVTIVHL
jgi:hypothetical protein